jgi:hypothetical protein
MKIKRQMESSNCSDYELFGLALYLMPIILLLHKLWLLEGN